MAWFGIQLGIIQQLLLNDSNQCANCLCNSCFTELYPQNSTYIICQTHRYTLEIPDLLYRQFNGIVSHGALSLGVFRFLQTWRGKSKCKNQCVHNLCASCCVLCVCHLHAQTVVDAETNCGYFDYEKKKNSEDPQFEPHAGIKMAQVLGSLLYICG